MERRHDGGRGMGGVPHCVSTLSSVGPCEARVARARSEEAARRRFCMAADAEAFLRNWHRIVKARDLEALGAVLAEDVTLGAPPYWTKLEGRPIVQHLLGIIISTIDGFTYHREWWRGAELALEFSGHVGDLQLQGVDLISLDDHGRVRNLDVPMRPVNAVTQLQKLVAPKMAAYLEAASKGS